MDESRLGREQIETSYLLRQITEAGVRAFAYLTGQERKLDSAAGRGILRSLLTGPITHNFSSRGRQAQLPVLR